MLALRFISRRIGIMIPTLFFVSIMIFGLQQLLPGDPASALAEDDATPELLAAIRAQYNLDRPLYEQYLIWIWNVLHGDFGQSIRMKLPVGDLIVQKLPVTIQLSLMALGFAFAIGIPAGIVSAVYVGRPIDVVANVFALSGISIPNFWLGIMMILIFAVHLRWLPASGYVPLSEDPIRSLQTLLMPAIVLGTGAAGVIMRHMRGAMLQALGEDYVRTARAKGLPEFRVVVKHAARNALVPVITLGALEFGQLLSGAVLTEQIFGVPGFGKLIVEAVFNRDYPVVQSLVLVIAIIYLTLNLIADLLYYVVSPKLRDSQ